MGLRDTVKRFFDPYLIRLYQKYPVFLAGDSPPYLPCAVLTAAVFAALLLLALLLQFGSAPFLALRPDFLKFLAFLPGAIVMVDRRASGWAILGYFVLAWITVTVVSGAFRLLLLGFL